MRFKHASLILYGRFLKGFKMQHYLHNKERKFSKKIIKEAKKLGVYNNMLSISALALIIDWKKLGLKISDNQKVQADKYFSWAHVKNVIPDLPKNSREWDYTLFPTMEAILAY
jgi:hypothetical protein